MPSSQSVKKACLQGSPPAAPIGVQGPKTPQYSPSPNGGGVGLGAHYTAFEKNEKFFVRFCNLVRPIDRKEDIPT